MFSGFLEQIFSWVIGSSDLNPKAQRFVFKAINLMLLTEFFSIGMTTFFVLFTLDRVSIEQLGILYTIQIITQSLLDYPTGALGDWVGQKWILFTAFLFYAIGYITFSYSITFYDFILAFILIGIGSSQQSGAFITWYDNNYKLYTPEDEDRRIYSFIMSRFQMLDLLNTGFAIVLIGGLVEFFGRQWGFFSLGLTYIISIILVLFLVNDNKDYQRPPKTKNEYLDLLGEGLIIAWNNRTLRYILIGNILSQGALMIWANLILYPIYESYAKADFMISLTRAIIWLYMAILMLGLGFIIRRITNTQKWLGILTMINMPSFFFMFFVFLQIVPSGTEFHILPWILLICAFCIVNSLGSLTMILRPKFFLDLIPDKNRNSIYSLIPTLVIIANIFTVSIGGFLIGSLGQVQTIFILAVIALLAGILSGAAILTHKETKSELKRRDITLFESLGK